MSSSLAQELFGQVGAVFHELITSLASEVSGKTYHFMEHEKFRQLLERSPGEGIRIYWTELLSRAHWAAASNILRHKRWHDACLKLYASEPNFLGFTACLRGLLEAAADAFYSLGAVPLTLADNHARIKEMLSGRAASFATSQELEDMLIHFHYARKPAKGEAMPDSHRAATADAYLRAADGTSRTDMKDLYAELCQVVHPAAQSVLRMTVGSEETGVLTGGEDKAWIQDLCKRHATAIDGVHMLSINTCILILKVLNRFPVRGLWTDRVNSVSMDSIPAWSKIQTAFAK